MADRSKCGRKQPGHTHPCLYRRNTTAYPRRSNRKKSESHVIPLIAHSIPLAHLSCFLANRAHACIKFSR
jgi:hypothetical protein